MKSREIIIKLIDENKINGTEAFELINDIVTAELVQARDILDNSNKQWGKLLNYPTIISPNTNAWNTAVYASGASGTSD